MAKCSRSNLCVVCTCGGHLYEALKAIRLYDERRYFVTDYSKRLRSTLHGQIVYYVSDHNFKPIAFLGNIIQSLVILLKERPDIVLSTGASLAIPTCLLAKLLGKRLIYVETGGNVYTPTKTGKLLYRFADEFLIQWRPLKKHFPRATLGGPLI
jgi:beta-1,4-N-acetylglucosaminyltransferase